MRGASFVYFDGRMTQTAAYVAQEVVSILLAHICSLFYAFNFHLSIDL